MSTFLKKGHKALSVGVTVTTIVWTLGLAALAPAAQAQTLSSGDLLQCKSTDAKCPKDRALYWFTADGKRLTFPNEKTFKTWYEDFKSVTIKQISYDELAAIPLAGNVSYRPGTRLGKITTDPKTYAIAPGGKLQWIKTEADAKKLYGDKWASMIDDIPDVFFGNYSAGAALDTPMLTDGRVVKTAASEDLYLVWGGKKRKLADFNAFKANNFNSAYISTVGQDLLDALPAGDAVTAAESTLTSPWGATGGVTVTQAPAAGKALSVALASDSPAAATLPSGSAFNQMTKLNLTAGSDGDVKITGIVLTRSGYTQDSAVSGVAVYNGDGVRHGNFVTFSDNKATLNFSAADTITVPAGKTIPLTIKANIIATAAGQSGTLSVGLAKASDITTTATVSGTFPMNGSTFSLTNGGSIVGTFTADAVQVHSNGATDATNVNMNLGDTDKEIARFRFSAGANEDLSIKKVTLYQSSNASDGDVTNLRLKGPDGAELAKVEKTASRTATFDLSAKPYALAKGLSRDFSVTADIANGSTRSVRFVVQNDYDIEVLGAGSGSLILPAANGTNDTTFPVGDQLAAGGYINRVTIAAGTLLFSKSTDSPTGNISAGGNSIVLGKWDVTAVGEDMELRALTYNITRSAATNLGGTFKITVGGSTVFSVSGSSATYGAATAASLSSFPLLKAGQKTTITATADILSTAANGLTYGVGLDLTSVKRMSTNDIVDPTLAENTANTLTVSSASLSLSRNSAMGNTNVVAGQQGAKIGSFILQAGSTEPVTVSSLTVALSNITNVSNLTLKVGTASLASPTATPAASNSISVSGLEIAANGTKTVDVYLDTNSSTANTEVVTLTVSNATGKNSGVSITATGSPAVGQTITFGAAGTLTMALNTSSSASSQLLHSGQTDVALADINLAANNFEDIRLKTLQLTITNGQASVSDASVKLYDGSTMVGSPTSVVGGLAEFGGLTYVVPKDTTKTLTVKLSTTNTATINSNSMLDVALTYLEATGAAGGATIKPGTTLNTVWSAVDVTVAGASLTVASNEGFEVGDVVYYQTTGAAGSNVGVVTAKTGTTGLTVGGRSAATFTTAGNVAKVATGATTAASAGTAVRAGAAITVTSTRGFSVGDPVLVYNATNGSQFGWVQAIGSDTSMTIRTITDQTAAASRVSKIGSGTPITTTWTAGNVALTGATTQTVGSSTGFNVGDFVIAQITDQDGTFGMISAITSTTNMTVLGNAAATASANGNLIRVGTNATGLVTTAASAGTLLRAGVAATVTSTTGLGVGDVVLASNTTDGAVLGRVTAVGSSTSATVAVTGESDGSEMDAAVSRMTRLPGAAAVSRAFNVHDVEPVLAVASGSPSGTATPSTSQEVGRLSLKADGDRNLSFTSLRLRKTGSNTPAANVTRFDLYITGSAQPISTVGTTSISGTEDDNAGNVAALTPLAADNTIELCTSAARAEADEIGGLSAAEIAHINVGDTLTLTEADTTAFTGTVTSKSADAAAACGVDGVTSTKIGLSGTTANTVVTGFTADQAVTITSDTLYFDGSAMNNNASVTDISMPSQSVTQGSTMTLSVYANTSNVRSGLGNVIATFGLSIPGTAGPEPSGAGTTAQAGGLAWSYTPSGGSATTSTASDNYPLNFPTLSY